MLWALGINHKSAPLAFRERLAFSKAKLGDAVQDLMMHTPCQEALILSTCNRTELYTCCANEDVVLNWWQSYHQFQDPLLDKNTYAHADERAVKHVMRVASGLDSMAIGEPQILGQLKWAYNQAEQKGALGKHLSRLMQNSFSVAKHVRTHTDIGSNPVSIAYAAVMLAKQLFHSLSSAKVLLLGVGETTELVGRHLVSQGVTDLIICNRTTYKAKQLAGKLGGQVIGFAKRHHALDEVDIVVSATGSDTFVLSADDFESTIKRRKHRPIFMLDLAIPRDISPQFGQFADVYLYTIDDLQGIIEKNRDLRQKAVFEAEQMIELHAKSYMAWLNGQDGFGTIKDIRGQVDELRSQELDKALKALNSGKDAQQVLERFAHDFSQKLLHKPTKELRQAVLKQQGGVLDVAKKLFGLP